MSALYRANSLATSAVLLSGLSVPALSRRVRTFHEPRVRDVVFGDFDFFCFVFALFARPLVWDPRQPRYAGQGFLKHAIFRPPFIGPSSCLEASSAVLKRAARSPRGLPSSPAASGTGKNDPSALGRLCAGL